MADLFVTIPDIEDMGNEIESPISITYGAGKLHVRGYFHLLWEHEFSAKLGFRKFASPRVTLEIEDSKPSLGKLDNFIKPAISELLKNKDISMIEVDYPLVTIDLTTIPNLEQALEHVEVQAIDFEETGIRINFRWKIQQDATV